MKRTAKIISENAESIKLTPLVMESICEDAIEALGVDMASIWFFDSKIERIKCQHVIDSLGQNSDAKGVVLEKSAYPDYFRAICEGSFVDAPDVRAHSGTKQLTEDYFDKFGITSLLDFIFRAKGAPVGVICCESRTLKSWTPEDINYLRGLAVLSAFHFHFDDSVS